MSSQQNNKQFVKELDESLRKKMGLTEEEWQEQHELFKEALAEPSIIRKVLPPRKIMEG